MARATNPVVQLAAAAVPIFADPTREYSYLARVRRHRLIKGGVRLSVLTNEDEEMTLDLRFVAPEVLRVRAYRPGEEPPLTSPMLVEGAQRSADATLETAGGKLVLTTSALVLKVVPRPFHFGLFDRRGRKLFVQQIADRSSSRLVSLPLGYSQDARGRVAFHESFELEPDERLFGLGRQCGPRDKRGQRIIFWNRDAGGTNTANLARHDAPFLQSSRGYGVFVHHATKIVYELGFPSTITCSFQVDDPYLDYFFIYGPRPKQILARYTDLTMSKDVDESAFQSEAVSNLCRQLGELADPTRAAQEKRYLKSPFDFYGVSVPQIRRIAKDFRAANRRTSKSVLWGLCQTLWAGSFHEERALAIFLLDEYRALLDYSDMPSLEEMLRGSVNWDQVDEISVHLVGAVLERDQRAFEYLQKWRRDGNFWMRRASLLSQLLLFRRGRGDRALFYALAREMMEEKEFFIRKAIGWVLRDISRREPEEVFRFVAENKPRMSGVTLREATRRLPPEMVERLGE
jgi:3-methyladenine DNA glycosylase AlkD